MSRNCPLICTIFITGLFLVKKYFTFIGFLSSRQGLGLSWARNIDPEMELER